MLSRPAPDSHVLEQGLASWIAGLNQERRAPLFEALNALQSRLDGQDLAAARALGELDWARAKILMPEHIMGSDKTKHGEIAEIAEVGVRRAKDLLAGRFPSSFLEETGAARTGPNDYGIGGTAVQSKFYNGLNNTLRGITEHVRKYPDTYGRDADAYFHLPSDQEALFRRIQSGDIEGIPARTVNAVRDHIRTLEGLRGQPADAFLRPASHTYAGVQTGRIGQTLDQDADSIRDENRTIKERIVDDKRDDIREAEAKAAPTAEEMGNVALKGAAVGAGIRITVSIYQKWKRDGKRPTEFTAQDWKEIGVGATEGAVVGGVSAAALYGLTNYSALSAPFAGAVVSSGRAMASLVQQYRADEITYEEFTDLSIVVTAEAGIAAAGAALGQVLIPIPILGAVIGSAVAKLASEHAKALLGAQSVAFAARLEQDFNAQISQLDAAHRALLADLDARMLQLHRLAELAFDLTLNAELLLVASAEHARAYGVPVGKIMTSTQEVDLFMSSGPTSPTVSSQTAQA